MPNPTSYVAPAKIEAFYADVFASAKAHQLSDAELIAVLSKIVGRMVVTATTRKDHETLRETAAYNIREGAAELSNVVDGLRRKF